MLTNEQIDSYVRQIVGAFITQQKIKPTQQEMQLIQAAVAVGVNFLQNINTMARR
jgi:hypothetical protein